MCASTQPPILEVPTAPFPDQRPGTSGLRKKTRIFMQPRYLENFVQAVFDSAAADATGGFARETLVVGGDGRYFNREAIQCILRMAAANGFGRVLVARSMPTSTVLDRVAAALGIRCYETPTGWKFFGDLLDAGLCTICGEESFGTGSSHLREKDGIWAVLCWLSILAFTGQSVTETAKDHWRRFGRSYFQRRDYEGLDAGPATALVEDLGRRLPQLAGSALAGSHVTQADDFAYRDPVSGEATAHGGLRIVLADGSRIVCRFSGTGTEGKTLRLYLEHYLPDGGGRDVASVLAPLRDAAVQLLEIGARCGRDRPTVIT